MPEAPSSEDRPAPQLVFVGMMGSGKTTVGRKVARQLDLEFLDTDVELADSTGRTVSEWFSEVGEPGFRAAEHEVLSRVLAHPRTRVIATGGGVVTRESNRILLADPRHRVIWLRASPEFLASRIMQKSSRKNRPLLGEDPRGALQHLDEERRDLYAEVADVVIDIEPAMATADKPRTALGALIVDTLARSSTPVVR